MAVSPGEDLSAARTIPPHWSVLQQPSPTPTRSDITLPIKPVTALANRVTADAQRGIADAHAMLAKRRKVAPAPWRADGFEATAWACTFSRVPQSLSWQQFGGGRRASGDSGQRTHGMLPEKQVGLIA